MSATILTRSGHPPNPFVWRWARDQVTPTAAFYAPDIARQRPWQVRIETAGKLSRGPGPEMTQSVRDDNRVALHGLRHVAVNAMPKGLEADDVRKLRNAAKSARRWRRSRK